MRRPTARRTATICGRPGAAMKDADTLCASDVWLRRLEHLSRRLRDHSKRTLLDSETGQIHDQIVEILDELRGSRAATVLLTHPAWQRLRDDLTEQNASLHQRTELAVAQQFLDDRRLRDPFTSSWITKGFPVLLQRQVKRWKRVGMFSGRRRALAVVGGGALPQSQVMLHRATGCDVVSIERDSESADMCRSVLRRLGYQSLRVREEDGIVSDYGQFQIVVVATLVQHKDMVAARVAETSASAAFAPRVPVGLHAIWRQGLDGEALREAGWALADAYTPRGSSIRSLLFVRGNKLVRRR
jgi:hypothetical protein